MRGAVVRAVVVSVVALGALAVFASGGFGAGGVLPTVLGPVVAGSTQLVCALTGHGEQATTKFGLVAGDRGYSFEYSGTVWWLFGDSSPLADFGDGDNANVLDRYPGPDAIGLEREDNDSMAYTAGPFPSPPPPAAAQPPKPCPISLNYPSGGAPVAGAYANPSVAPDPLTALQPDSQVSLRTGESAVSGITVDGKMYVTFATDNPVDAGLPGNCWPSKKPHKKPPKCLGHQTRSVMAVLENPSSLRFRSIYDLSAPHPRYSSGAKFVDTAIEPSGAYIYIWGTEGGIDYLHSPPFLARMRPSEIGLAAAGSGLAGANAVPKEIFYYAGLGDGGAPKWVANSEASAAPLFHDTPTDCMGELGVQWNPYVNAWVMLYNCADNTTGHPNGIYMRTAANPWGPWSAPQTIFNPTPNPTGETGFCYFIHSTATSGPDACKNDPGSLNPPGRGIHGADYGPYFIAHWTRGASTPESSTIYYTIDTDNPYGQVVVQTTIQREPLPKPSPPTCKPTACT